VIPRPGSKSDFLFISRMGLDGPSFFPLGLWSSFDGEGSPPTFAPFSPNWPFLPAFATMQRSVPLAFPLGRMVFSFSFLVRLLLIPAKVVAIDLLFIGIQPISFFPALGALHPIV